MGGIRVSRAQPTLHEMGLDDPADIGLLGWTSPVKGGGSATYTLTTAGVVFFNTLFMVHAGPITNLYYRVTAAGNTLTSGQCFIGVWDFLTLALLGVTADLSTVWASPGNKETPLATPTVSLAAGRRVKIGAWFNGTGGPTFATPMALTTHMRANITAAQILHGRASSGTTTAAPDPLGSAQENAAPWWCGVA